MKAKNLCRAHYLPLYFASHPLTKRGKANLALIREPLVQLVRDYSEIQLKQAYRAVDAIFDSMIQSLKRGDPVYIPGFGTFSRYKPTPKAKRFRVRFSPSPELTYLVDHPSFRIS